MKASLAMDIARHLPMDESSDSAELRKATDELRQAVGLEDRESS